MAFQEYSSYDGLGQFTMLFEKHDLWITPALGCPSFKVGAIDFQSPSASMLDQNILTLAQVNPFYNVTGQPALSLPLHWTAARGPFCWKVWRRGDPLQTCRADRTSPTVEGPASSLLGIKKEEEVSNNVT